jgi:hypothetical protein
MYLNGELWFDPVCALDCNGDLRKRRRLRFQRPQPRPDHTKLRIGEPRRHAPDIPQLALLVSDPEQQRSEKRTRTPRFGPAADDGCMDHGKFKMQNSKFKHDVARSTTVNVAATSTPLSQTQELFAF